MDEKRSRKFRDAMGSFCSGVVVVTGMEGNAPVGFTAQSFVSLSLKPSLIAICPSKSSTSWPKIKRSGSFCVNILRDDQSELSTSFAQSGGEKFHNVNWSAGKTLSPVLDDVLCFVECNLTAEHDAGDHSIVIGSVVVFGFDEDADDPLLFFQGGYGSFQRM